MDDIYQTYLNRVARMTLTEAYSSQVQHIKESAKFQPTCSTTGREAAPFPGYTVITPPGELDSLNFDFYKRLGAFQKELLELSPNKDLIIPLPANSFHVTLADLIWDSSYRDACEKFPDFESDLRSCFSEIFSQYQQSQNNNDNLIRWLVTGLIMMPRAVAVCLTPENENAYEKILNLRRLVYQNPKLMALGIEQHYHFTAHVTLGYFGEIPANLDRTQLANIFYQLNEQWLSDSAQFIIHRAELRKFDDMTRYYRESDWPYLELGVRS